MSILGISYYRQRWAGWDAGDQKYKNRKINPKQKFFFSFLKKNWARDIKKM